MEQITKERIKEILDKFKKDKDLFNWCKEYNQFIGEQVVLNVTSEISYIIQKSYEDVNAPLSHEDLDEERTKSLKENDIMERMAFNLKVDKNILVKVYEESKDNTKENFKINNDSYDCEDLDNLFNEAKQELIDEIEVYSWYVVGDRLRYWLEQEGEIILNGSYWGRQAGGQSVALDYPVIHAFIRMLEEWIE